MRAHSVRWLYDVLVFPKLVKIGWTQLPSVLCLYIFLNNAKFKCTMYCGYEVILGQRWDLIHVLFSLDWLAGSQLQEKCP